MCTPALVAEHVAGRDVRVLLGPASELGRAATLRRDDLGTAVLHRWLDLVGPEQLAVEVVSHRLSGSGPGSSPHAARMAGLARSGRGSARVPVVLSNAVRFADRLDAPTIDVLDAARRLVPMDPRHLDRRNAEGFLKSGKQMHEVAEEISRCAGLGDRGAHDLLAQTRALADQCVLDPRQDLGIGEVHFPEFEISTDPRLPSGSQEVGSRPTGQKPSSSASLLRPLSTRSLLDRLGSPSGGTPLPIKRSGTGARRRSGGGSGTLLGSGSGSGSTTSSRRSARSATRRTSSPSATSPR